MNAFFHNAYRRCSLLAAAVSWRGTPWMPHGAARGLGVSPRMLVRMLYHEAGWEPAGLEWDPLLRSALRWESLGVWLRSCRWFAVAERVEPGDLVLRAGSEWQLGIAIPDPARLSESQHLVQCSPPGGVTTANISEPRWNSGPRWVLRPLALPRAMER